MAQERENRLSQPGRSVDEARRSFRQPWELSTTPTWLAGGQNVPSVRSPMWQENMVLLSKAQGAMRVVRAASSGDEPDSNRPSWLE